MTGVAGKGSAMHIEFVPVRYESRSGPDRKLGHEDVAKVRKLLRSTMTINEIAARLHVSNTTLKTFIKRRQICNMKARHDFISLQQSLVREDQRCASK
jgi:hypothetical protein